MTARRSFAALVATLAAAFAAATAARAQDAPPQVISPLRVETDHNGVNMVSGKTRIELPVLSVPGAPNLRFDRVQNAAPYVSGRITGAPGTIPQASYSVHSGTGSSESFQCPDYDCASVTGTGSTFQHASRVYRQAGSGARWNFDVIHVDTPGPPARALLYYASSVTYPNGEVISYSYETAYLPGDPYNRPFRRPVTVASSMGYHIAISYQPGALGEMGWNTPAQATLYATGNGTPLQQLTYNATATTVTDIGGRVYQCTGCNNALGTDLEVADGSTQLPTEGTQSRQVVANPSAPVVASVVNDGVGWSYAYLNLRANPGTQSWLYDRVTVTGPNGFNQVYNVAQIGMGPQARNVITSMTDSIGRTSSFLFDEAYRPYRVVYPEGNQVDVSYDAYGNLNWRRTRAKPGSGLADIIEQAYFPGASLPNLCTVSCWRPTWSQDGLGRQTDYLYNANGQLTQQDDPADANGVRRRTIVEYALSPVAGISRRSVVRVCGVGTTCGTSQEIRTEYQYLGDTLLPTLERRVDPATGAVLDTTYGYDNAGRLLWTDGPLPGNADAGYNRYDQYGRKTWEIGPASATGVRPASYFEYRPSDDKPTSVQTGTVTDTVNPVLTPLSRTDLVYDSRRNAVRETVSAGGTAYAMTQRSFQDIGRLECQAVRMNPAAFASPPASACALGTQGSFGPDRITRNVYDNAGQLLQAQRAYGTALQQNYATYTYSANGRQTSVTDANGNRAEMAWDGYDRQRRWIFPSPTTPGVANPADYEEYGYDLIGNRTSLRKRDGVTLTYAYDNLNRVTLKTVPASASGAPGYSVYYAYDLRNMQLHARFGSASGPGIVNVYDGFGRLASSTNSMGGAGRTLAYQYDAGSRRSRLTLPDGNYFTYDYDPAARLTAIRENGGTQIAGFAYDSALRPSASSFAGAAATRTYDPVSRLSILGHDLAGTGADQSLTFGYNPASQIVTRAATNDIYAWTGAVNVNRNYARNGLNQYTSAGPATFGYDANGNLTSDGSNVYVYDAENRLVSASGATSAALSYDPLGRLFQTSGGAAGTTQFLYDGDELVAEYNGSGTLLRRYAHGLGNDDPIVWYEGSGLATRRSLFANHQGSIVAVADSSGSQAAINAYDEWGIPNAANQGRFQYTGQAWIAELGMYYYKARIYSPTLGRFLQSDPVGYEDQMNLYAYVGNDPVNAVDPSGMAICGGCSGYTVEYDTRNMAAARRREDSASEIFTNLERQNDRTQEDPQSARYSSERAAARGWSQRWGRVASSLGRNRELVSRLMSRVSEGRNVYSFTLPHAVTQRVDRFGEPIPFSTTFDVQSIGWTGLRYIHSHSYPGGGFSAADISFARGRGNYVWEPGEGGGILRYLSPRAAETATEPAEGNVVCARVNECEE